MLKKFDDHKSAQAWLIIDDNDEIRGLMSYNTQVATIDDENWLSFYDLDHGNTTRKHIGWFMCKLGFTYQWAKQLYFDNMKFNLTTGEVAPL